MSRLGDNSHARGEAIPPDTEILRLVVAACLAMPDLYPTLHGDPR